MGRIAGPYGVHGWLRVQPYSELPDALAAHRTWRVGGRDYTLEESRVHSGSLLAKLAGIESPEAARALKGAAVELARSALPQLPPGEYYWADLVGLSVVNTRGVRLGVIEEVFSNGAHEILRVAGEKTRLLPWVETVIKQIDLAAREIAVEWEADW
jgi:16S rRNA processing protein RimM